MILIGLEPKGEKEILWGKRHFDAWLMGSRMLFATTPIGN